MRIYSRSMRMMLMEVEIDGIDQFRHMFVIEKIRVIIDPMLVNKGLSSD